MKFLWLALKGVLTLILLAVVGLLLLMFRHKTGAYVLLGGAAVFLFMAALLWIKLDADSREVGLVGIMFSLGCLFLGAQSLTGARHYPRACSGKRLWCELENALHAAGGPVLAAAPTVLLGLVVLYFSIRRVARRSLRR